jgi:23S rRNA pseudouridine1911/1915/1917 synthase
MRRLLLASSPARVLVSAARPSGLIVAPLRPRMEREVAAGAAAAANGGGGSDGGAGGDDAAAVPTQQQPQPSSKPSAARAAAQRAFESVGAAVAAPAPKLGRAARRRQVAGRDPAPPRGGNGGDGRPRPSDAEIQARIREQAARRAARQPMGCPACAAAFFNPASLRSHLLRCCPDLFVGAGAVGANAATSPPPSLWPASGPAPAQADVERAMSAAAALEAAKRRAALEITFLEPVERAEAEGSARPVWAAEADDDGDRDDDDDDDEGDEEDEEGDEEDEEGQADRGGRRRKRAAEAGDGDDDAQNHHQQQQRQQHHHDPRRATVAEARRARIAAAPSDIAQRLAVPADRAARLLRSAMRAIPLPADPEGLTPEGFPLVFEDARVLAVAKPPGVRTAPIHRWRGGSMVNRALAHLGKGGGDSSSSAPSPPAAPHVVHRLDLNTSGVLLFAKTPDAARRLHEQFRARRARKTYLALVIGVPEKEEFEVDAAIARHPALKEARLALEDGGAVGQEGGDDDDEAPKPARTRFRVLASNPSAELGCVPGARPARLYNWSSGGGQQQPSADLPPPPPPLPPRGAALVQCFPLTGRTHQIRVHLVAAGHPIVGDDIYGAEGPWLARQALHAQVLEVEYPAAAAAATAGEAPQPLRLVAPPPPDFVRAMEMLGLDMPAE